MTKKVYIKHTWLIAGMILFVFTLMLGCDSGIGEQQEDVQVASPLIPALDDNPATRVVGRMGKPNTVVDSNGRAYTPDELIKLELVSIRSDVFREPTQKALYDNKEVEGRIARLLGVDANVAREIEQYYYTYGLETLELNRLMDEGKMTRSEAREEYFPIRDRVIEEISSILTAEQFKMFRDNFPIARD